MLTSDETDPYPSYLYIFRWIKMLLFPFLQDQEPWSTRKNNRKNDDCGQRVFPSTRERKSEALLCGYKKDDETLHKFQRRLRESL